jgi:hypothetical protein
MVAVGTRISPRPPHRSRRALLTHRAPPSGSGVEAVTRQRVYRSDWRKETGDELDEPLPAEACRLAASLERCEPEPLHLVEEPPQARVVMQLQSTLTCPKCSYQAVETMQTDACRFFYECKGCGERLKPLAGDCCVFCSYGSAPCPNVH